MSFFSSAKAWLTKFFDKAPSWEQAAAVSLNLAAPLLGTVVGLTAGTGAEGEAESVITKVQTDMATLSVAIQHGQVTPSLSGVLDDIKENLGGLLQVAEIKNSTKVGEITSVTNTIINEIEAIAAEFPH
jgi:hypothetical protein